jgi:hypothetical protein
MTAPIDPGGTFGRWTVLSIDASARRAEAAIRDGAVKALRRRAALLQQAAALGVDVLDQGHRPPVRAIASEAALALRIARDWDRIADEIEGGAS